ncbi:MULTISPECIES: hypothetical protein [Corallococcus]|uniref:hypothetical protein n=1 Tax=Corallococcus TaxID=83461 RepID=UPI0011C4610A|nr:MULTISPECIES: hypothetical protein [Corallococcus]NPC75528.1 hypothetical protein [Corallococcus exiguus]NPD28585.1 hypothetical protein [Corallococcus exiguus]NRD50876.1 hypothetical protein [Corallococcus exiguus]
MRHTLTPRHGLLTGLAVLHLLMVARGALHVPLLPLTDTGRPWAQAYGHWTGSSSGFSFFAPGVSPAVRVSFDLEGASGEQLHDDFRSDNGAVSVRIHSMNLRFSLEESRDALARAWAAAMFGRHPDAKAVTVRVESLQLPSMEGHMQGSQPLWTEAYRAEFQRRVPAAVSTGEVTP